MYNSKMVEKAEKRANEILSKRDSDLKSRIADREAAEKLLAKADSDMAAAVASGDPTAYSKAKHARAEVADRIEMDNKILSGLKSNPLTSAEEVKKYETDLKAALSEKDEECYKKVLEHFNAVRDIMKEYLVVDENIKDVLYTWQHDIGKQQSVYRYIYTSKTIKLADAIDDPQYKEAAGYIPTYQRLDVSLREELKIK